MVYENSTDKMYFLLMGSDKSTWDILKYFSGRATDSVAGQYKKKLDAFRKDPFISYQKYRWVPLEGRLRGREFRNINCIKEVKDKRQSNFELNYKQFLNYLLDQFFEVLQGYSTIFTKKETARYKTAIKRYLQKSGVRSVMFNTEKWADIFRNYEFDYDTRDGIEIRGAVSKHEKGKKFKDMHKIYFSEPETLKTYFPFRTIVGYLNFCFIHTLIEYMMIQKRFSHIPLSILYNRLIRTCCDFLNDISIEGVVSKIEIQELQKKSGSGINRESISRSRRHKIIFNILSRSSWEISPDSQYFPNNLKQPLTGIPAGLIRILAEIYGKFFMSSHHKESFFEMINTGIRRRGIKNPNYLSMSEIFSLDISGKLRYLLKG